MFKGIEGARAWLAWAVVFSHIALLSGLSSVPHLSFLAGFGHESVRVFIIISGFVITNLVITNREPYLIYLARRALRLFPAYLICLGLGIVAMPLSFAALTDYSHTEAHQLQFLILSGQQFHDHFWQHFALHISLLQGIVPNDVLAESQFMFLPPAWSLTLEWQFYLIAPIWIYWVRRAPITVVLATLAVSILYKHYLSSQFESPSFLFGAALFFLVGICTRLAIDRLPKLETYPFAAVLILFGIAMGAQEIVPFALWAALVIYLEQERNWVIFDGTFARAAGARSYGVYVLHFPVLWATLYLAISICKLPFWYVVAFSMVSTIVGTIIGTEILYRFIERPAIALGRKIGQSRAPISMRSERVGW